MLNLLSAITTPPVLLVGTYVTVAALRRSMPVGWAGLVIGVQLLAAFLIPPTNPHGSGYFVGVPPHLSGVVMAVTTALVARPLLVHVGYRIAVAILATAWWTGSVVVATTDIAGGANGDLAWFWQLPVVGGMTFGVAAGWSLIVGIPLAGEYGSHWDNWPPHRWGGLMVWLGLLAGLVAMAPAEHRARAWAVACSGAVLFVYAVGWCAYLD